MRIKQSVHWLSFKKLSQHARRQKLGKLVITKAFCHEVIDFFVIKIINE